MAATINISSDFSEQASIHSTKPVTIKSLSESGLTSIPSSFVSKTLQDLPVLDSSEDAIPVVDFSLLSSGNSKQRHKAIQDLGQACEEWGCFLVKEICSSYLDFAETELFCSFALNQLVNSRKMTCILGCSLDASADPQRIKRFFTR